MNNEISKNIIKAGGELQTFSIDPKANNKNYLLGSLLDDINGIDLTTSKLSESDYKKFRLSLLMLHLNVLQEFDKYYIQNYKPNKKYTINLMPPSNAIDGPIFGPIDPAQIKDEKIREAYEKDLLENSELGKEIALQSELSALKLKLSMYNNKIGVISDSVSFISRYYTNSTPDQVEVKRTINSLFHGSEREKQILKSLSDVSNK
ncbi:hypothetical protein ACN5LI_000757 [Cronobacter turicensis]|nr:hypothetical protein [Cronobacter turicensis]ELQ6077739.1 hypothetical protein [Cronobacter turicensis]ELQ6185094.1 hypothetical protein [Cronobacter turicensis]ELQ6231483.1 hypothetical protein [Cronobacter turicensis]ELQ6239615.1 hypothetical protein [Cronobacter turicensis]